MVLTQGELQKRYIWVDVPVEYLCFTANTAGSTVQLLKAGTPAELTLEISTDGNTWSTYTFGDNITLSNVGDKLYFRNTSETDTGFSTNQYNYYKFLMSGSIGASGDITFLLNKNGTDTVPNHGFRDLFSSQTALTSAPNFPATTTGNYSYYNMFNGCTNLVTAPSIGATTLLSNTCYQMFANCTNLEELPKLKSLILGTYCYYNMFYGCSKIKLSETQTGEYVNEYRIPITGTGTIYYGTEMGYMFAGTGGTFAYTPEINKTYYTSNTIV